MNYNTFEKISTLSLDRLMGRVMCIGTTSLRSVYLGIDLTSDSLHIGHLLPLIWLNNYAKISKYRSYLVLGDGTTVIGDPTGRSTERPQITSLEIYANSVSLIRQIRILFPRLNLLFNSSWLGGMQLTDFLRWEARFSLNEVLGWDTFRNRYSRGLKISEILYPSIQAYDFYWLGSHMDVNGQLAGMDQINNVKLGRRLIDGVGLFLPLIVDRTGKKIGKSTCKYLSLRLGMVDVDKFFFHLVRNSHVVSSLVSHLDGVCSESEMYETLLSLKGLTSDLSRRMLRLSRTGEYLVYHRDDMSVVNFGVEFLNISTRTAVKNYLRSSHLSVEGEGASGSYLLRVGDRVRFGRLRFFVI